MSRAMALVMIGLLGAAGCGQPRGTVQGVLMVQGQPLANVLVAFVPDPDRGGTSGRSVGVTDAEGRFQLRGDDRRPGAPTGWHRVVLEDLNIYELPRSNDGRLLEQPIERFPPRYSDILRTPLLREVIAGAQVIDLELPAE